MAVSDSSDGSLRDRCGRNCLDNVAKAHRDSKTENSGAEPQTPCINGRNKRDSGK